MIIAHYRDDKLIQTDISGRDPICVNGAFLIDVPEMITLTLDDSSNVTTLTGTTIPDALLAAYPAYSTLIWNPLLTALAQTQIDSSAVFPDPVGGNYPSRLQKGSLPNSLAIIEKNSAMSRPGVVITQEYTLPTPAQTFVVYYRVGAVSWSADTVPTGLDPIANSGGKKYLNVADQTPADFTVYISADNGSSYQEAERLVPVSFGATTSSIRLAFVNNSDTKLNLLSYGILY